MESFAASCSLIFAGLICAAYLELASCQLNKNLYFSFITAHSKQYTALGAVPAVNLALERINSDPTILPGYNLSYAGDVGNSLVSSVGCTGMEIRLCMVMHALVPPQDMQRCTPNALMLMEYNYVLTNVVTIIVTHAHKITALLISV